MNHDLYFLPLITRALEQADRAAALLQAFVEIEELGRRPAYARGFENFGRFMAEVRHHLVSREGQAADAESMRTLLVELATGAFGGNEAERAALADLIRAHPELSEVCQQLISTVGTSGDEERVVGLRLMRDRAVIAHLELDCEHPRQSIGSILPGDYALETESGRLLWEARLTARDLLWGAAFPGRALDLAADTGEPPAIVTREERLLGGELILRSP